MSDFEAILKTEYSAAFDEHRKKAMINSFYKYGPANPRVLYNPTENSRQVTVAFRTVAIILLAVTVILTLFK
jgi:hypothetical protein